MGNAIKFSYENSSIQLSLTQAEGKVLITVKDSGIGIANKGSEHIFDMFTESKTYGTKGEKPHGIGLSIALQVARAHGGDIWFESEEGKGTTFYLSLPLNF
jgi:two-component system sensor histidine kinase VicK